MPARQDYLLTFLGLPSANYYTDQIRVMKAMFLLSQEGPAPLRGLYDFVAYDYGPFDTRVYHDLENLERSGFIEVSHVSGTNRRVYDVTDRGRREAASLMGTLPHDVLSALRATKKLVTSRSFKSLLEYVYTRHPKYASRSLYRPR